MYAALHIADLPIVAALRREPRWREQPCAVLTGDSDRKNGTIPLLALNATARRTGIAAGWPLNRAMVRCPDLLVLSRQPDAENALLTELVALAEGFTPDLEITSTDLVLLDLTASRHVDFLEFQTLILEDTEICHAFAETPDLAHLAVLDEATRGRFIDAAALENLPIALLAKLNDDAAFLPLLELLGIRTLGDYRRLPRQDLTERFGPLAGDWHDLISARSRRLLKLHRPPESLCQSIDFEDAIHTTEALVFIFNRLLQVLAARLNARHVAAASLDLRLQLESGGAMRRTIQLPEPLTDPAELLRPLQTLAESLVLESPVSGLTLDATTTSPLARQSDWTRRQLPRPERWADTLARLKALLGNDRVGIPTPLPSHRSDAFEIRDATGVSIFAETTPPLCSIPLRRFRPPLNIAVAFDALSNNYPRPLALLTGPHCGEIIDQRGPFPTSGDYWEPGNEWRRLEWDVKVGRAPLLRLVWQNADRWQLDGIYG